MTQTKYHPPLLFPPFLCVQVTCLACDHRSNTVEPFWDLSLEFPERYHSNSRESAAQASCHLTEMLAKFTETEALEGNIYACDQCNCESVNMSALFIFNIYPSKFTYIIILTSHKFLFPPRFRFVNLIHYTEYCSRWYLSILIWKK